MTLDFARARRDSSFALLALDKIENVFLPVGQHVSNDAARPAQCKFK